MYGSSSTDFHLLRIGDEVRRDVAAIELHAFDRVEVGLEAAGFLNGDDAVLADLLHRVGDQVADFLVVVRRDGADLGDFLLAGRRDADPLELFDDRFDGLLDAALDRHRIRAGRDVLEAFAEDRLCEHSRRRRAVAGDVRRLGRDFLHHLRAHVLERIASSISFATVTPSLVTVGAPNFLSMTTFRPFGPRVTFTASASWSTPRLRAARASTLKWSSFAAIWKTL